MATLNYKPCYTYIYGLGNLEHVILMLNTLIGDILKNPGRSENYYFQNVSFIRLYLVSNQLT